MKRSFRFVRFIIFVLVLSIIVFTGGAKLKNYILKKYFTIPQGTVTVVSLDAETGLPIKNSEFTVIDYEAHNIIEVLVTDENGVAVSQLLNYKKEYLVEQTKVPFPYKLNNEAEVRFELNEENYEIVTKSSLYEHIKNIERTEDGNIKVKEVYINVPTLMQNPELPNGCEITSLTAILNYYGNNVSKLEMSDRYLRKEGFIRKNGKLYGANPYVAFSGDPRDPLGWFVYAPPIVEAGDMYLKEVQSNLRAKDISGSSIEEIYDYLNNGNPIVIWTSIDQQPIRFNYSWYLHDSDSDELFKAATNLHAVVLNGFVGDKLHVMDPLKGQVLYDGNTFFEGYFSLDRQAMIVY